MTPRALVRLLGAYLIVILVSGLALRHHVRLTDTRAYYQSRWRDGRLIERHAIARPEAAAPTGQGVVTLDTVIGTAPLVTALPYSFMFGVVSGRDGVEAKFRGRVALLTPDDLLARQAYDHGINQAGISLSYGLDVELVYAMLAERLAAAVADVKREAVLRRLRIERQLVQGPAPPDYRADTMTREAVRAAALDAARFLARGQGTDGDFRYMIDAASNDSIPGYDWARHAGATYFLAQAAAVSGDTELRTAALRGAALLRNHALVYCGANPCIAEHPIAEIGSSALTLLAFVEITRTGLDPSYSVFIAPLAAFLRAQQRADGEMMHEYDRRISHPIDVQRLYYTGEAALALGRAHRITHDPADLSAAARALAYLVGPAWRFVGDRYYFGEEHWTCQAVAELWDRAPNPQALDFCARWQAYGRKMQFQAGETPYDAEGAYGVSPLVTPRLTPVASRSEAGVALLEVEKRTNAPASEIAALDLQLRRSLALLMRHQLRPGPAYVFTKPAAVYGALPGSAVDWQLRIDYAQHAGSAMLGWLAVTQ